MIVRQKCFKCHFTCTRHDVPHFLSVRRDAQDEKKLLVFFVGKENIYSTNGVHWSGHTWHITDVSKKRFRIDRTDVPIYFHMRCLWGVFIFSAVGIHRHHCWNIISWGTSYFLAQMKWDPLSLRFRPSLTRAVIWKHNARRVPHMQKFSSKAFPNHFPEWKLCIHNIGSRVRSTIRSCSLQIEKYFRFPCETMMALNCHYFW